jgi:hypothetical protein
MLASMRFAAPAAAAVRAAVVALAAAAPAACDAPAAPPPPPPPWDTCANEPRATAETLAAKAAAYDARALALHVGPATPWVLDVELVPGADPRTATAADVRAWRSGENDGLWSALALASQAYRYAATHDAAALAALRTLLDGEQKRARITGVPGLFTRQLIPPGVAGLACPTDATLYVPSPTKTANRWVRVGADGCAQTADATTLAFASTTHCGLDAFAGWCFLDNVSQDEYVGHVFALGAVARLVDVADVHAAAAALLDDVGHHLLAHNMEFVDWDGRATQWGKVHPGAPGDTPGYLAVMGASFLATAAGATGDDALVSGYRAIADDYTTYFDQIDLFMGAAGCTSNWNDLSMLAANFYDWSWFESDAARRARVLGALDASLMQAPVARAGATQKNAWWNVMWAAQSGRGSGDAATRAAVATALCQLRQFPASNQTAARDTSALAADACAGRSGESLAYAPFDVADRCAATFVWWGDPYERRACADEPTMVQQPAGYLLPYWMARYHGFLGATE